MRKALIVLLAFVSLAIAQQSPYYLKSGDRVVFYGDSITDQRLYTTFVESYTVTRFPNLNVAFIHSGWGGDRVTGGGGGPIDLRLKRDVFAYSPTVVTIMLGMNDGRYKAFDQATFDEFANGYRHIIETIKANAPGARIVAIQPSPYDDVTRAPLFEGGYNAVLLRYGAFLRDLATKEHLDIADLNTSVVASLDRAKAIDPAKAADLIRDRIHPGAGGHLLMAEALLKAWNAPSVVASVEIDAGRGKVTKSENTEATISPGSGMGVQWTQQDAALPMPLNMKDAAVDLALQSSDFLDALDREMVRVTGLSAPSYTLKIDDDVVGTFTKAQLADGVNIAALPTPMLKQALAVHDLTLKHNNIHFARWRQVQVPLEKESLARVDAAMSALDALETELVAKQRELAKPAPHRFALVPAETGASTGTR